MTVFPLPLLLAACGEAPRDPSIDADRFLANVSTLASDAFGGRAPMSEGERLTLDFVESGFREAGLEPLFGASYRQPVELVSMHVDPATALMTLRPTDEEDGEARTLAYADEMVVWTQQVTPQMHVQDSQIVFVGYGVVAPEYGWDDYAGVDMRGKTALILINDPGFALQDPSMFNGNAMTYYGRWRYKFEEAARQGAAAAVIIHDTKPASYGWNTVRNSWTGPQFYLPRQNGLEPVQLESWIQKDVAESMLEASGLTLAELQQRARSAEFTPVPLNTALSASVDNRIERGESYNVGGILRGSEEPGEAFLYVAHWDHIGTGTAEEPGEDVIYNGAVDNATGTAALIELAHAFSALPREPRRSVAFLAVTAEESGLLGSAWYAENPAVPMHRTVGGLNIDAMPVYGPTKDVVVVGFGSSELEETLRDAARAQGRAVEPEPHPERGYYYRSDHFRFAHKGVPMLYAESGTEHREAGPGYIEARSEEFTEKYYHQPGDEVRADWDLRGTMEDIELYFEIGLEVANSNSWPEWYKGNEFRAIREASLR